MISASEFLLLCIAHQMQFNTLPIYAIFSIVYSTQSGLYDLRTITIHCDDIRFGWTFFHCSELKKRKKTFGKCVCD